MKHVFASFAFIVIGCGGPLDPGSGSTPGSGTGTLEVRGNASAEPRFDNAHLPGEFDTEFGVRVFLGGNQVRTGTVTVTSRFATMPLSWTDADGGHWTGRVAGYDEVYQLDVISGPDDVTGVIVDGPDIHAFIEPLPGATLDSTVPNDLIWDSSDVADFASLDGEFDRITIADTGLYSMGIGLLRAERDQARTNQLELRRTNQLVPGGAVGDSSFSVTVRNEMEVVVQPNPLLP